MANFVWRGLVAIFGICAIAWAIEAIFVYSSDAPLEDTTQRIMSGDRFNAAQLNAIKLQLDAGPANKPRQASAMAALAIIRLLLLENEPKLGRPSASDLDELQMLVSAALARAPTNSFLWLTDLWLRRLRIESAGSDLTLLRMSYLSGPNEAWIAVKRNSLALGIFPSLPNELAEQVLSEFVGLVRSGLYVDASNILAGPGWPFRDQLVGRLVQVEEAHRRRFASALASKNLVGVTVPGLDERPARPF